MNAATIRTVAALLGVALVSYGAWRAWPPAGFIVAGAVLLGGAIASHLANVRRNLARGGEVELR